MDESSVYMSGFVFLSITADELEKVLLCLLCMFREQRGILGKTVTCVLTGGLSRIIMSSMVIKRMCTVACNDLPYAYSRMKLRGAGWRRIPR